MKLLFALFAFSLAAFSQTVNLRYGGSGAWADPSRQLAVGYIVNTGSGSPFADLRLWRINTAIIQAAGG